MLKFLVTLSLDLCSRSEVQQDNRARAQRRNSPYRCSQPFLVALLAYSVHNAHEVKILEDPEGTGVPGDSKGGQSKCVSLCLSKMGAGVTENSMWPQFCSNLNLFSIQNESNGVLRNHRERCHILSCSYYFPGFTNFHAESDDLEGRGKTVQHMVSFPSSSSLLRSKPKVETGGCVCAARREWKWCGFLHRFHRPRQNETPRTHVQTTKHELCQFSDLAQLRHWYFHLKLVLHNLKMDSKIPANNLKFLNSK